MPLKSPKRCPNGFHKNKQGNCEPKYKSNNPGLKRADDVRKAKEHDRGLMIYMQCNATLFLNGEKLRDVGDIYEIDNGGILMDLEKRVTENVENQSFTWGSVGIHNVGKDIVRMRPGDYKGAEAVFLAPKAAIGSKLRPMTTKIGKYNFRLVWDTIAEVDS